MLPTATYRLQFNRDFTFSDATRIIPYLHQLGVSHIYASPYLKARAGSEHGYDIVDHNSLNPEIGDGAAFDEFVNTLKQHDMGQILDIVPNHMGVGGDDNCWWLDVLEHGQASAYADYFDIDWHPVKTALNNKVLLPFLGDYYGKVLEADELKLNFDADNGAFNVRYYEHLFPLDPRTYPAILNLLKNNATADTAPDSTAMAELRAIISACQALPRRTDLSTPQQQRRRSGADTCKQRLAQLFRNHAPFDEPLQRTIATFNNDDPQQPGTFDLLHRLLEKQAYRLAYWQVALDEINYRRFFDINDLAGLRMDNPKVFDATHNLIRTMISAGSVDGLRIDHPDGLYDPKSYCRELQQLTRSADTGRHGDHYLLVEKILASYERLPDDWPVAGTTGYEAAFLLNGLFIKPNGENRLNRIYRRFTGNDIDFSALLYERKKLIIQRTLSSELSVLANLLDTVSESDRHTRDFTLQGLRDALSEVVACFPVYRTYITPRHISDTDRRYLQWATGQAKRRNPATDKLIFDFIHERLLPESLHDQPKNIQRRNIQFMVRFQQYTAPVMAKALEDTSFYIYNRLVSLNDVGFNPQIFGTTPATFHEENRLRLKQWPNSLVNTSTHDSKRSEDVRARINVLSELAVEWHHRVKRWNKTNRHNKRLLENETAPSHNDEYLLYQTLIGTWPLSGRSLLDYPDELNDFRERIESYMIKAVREAKVHSSWISPDEAYEEAVTHFIHCLVDCRQDNQFLADFLPFQHRIAHLGLYNSLSQTALKLTIPGVPDIYQGNEVFTFNLVDPDNRRAVEHERHHRQLQELQQQAQNSTPPGELVRKLLEQLEDGCAKLYLTWKLLDLRRRHPELFRSGDYIDLTSEGRRADHICAFARRLENHSVIVAAARWFADLTEGDELLPLHTQVWSDTRVEEPANTTVQTYYNLLTKEVVHSEAEGDRAWFQAAELFRNFPVAVLTSEPDYS